MAKKILFLVVVDDSEEMHHALRFACGRASAVGGKVGLMCCIASRIRILGRGGADAGRGARGSRGEHGHHAAYAQELTGDMPILYVREGEIGDELLNLIDESSRSAFWCSAPTPNRRPPGRSSPL